MTKEEISAIIKNESNGLNSLSSASKIKEGFDQETQSLRSRVEKLEGALKEIETVLNPDTWSFSFVTNLKSIASEASYQGESIGSIVINIRPIYYSEYFNLSGNFK